HHDGMDTSAEPQILQEGWLIELACRLGWSTALIQGSRAASTALQSLSKDHTASRVLGGGGRLSIRRALT
ncbi:hypothetical protein PCASD_17428, partial [Puccinia coronata f. sp. avenae]